MKASLENERCSRARYSRDPRFDGLFFTAVKTTGIYCRPICPARAPKEENVVYYETAVAAAQAGYRPCLRCRPEAAPGTPAWRGTETTVSRALGMIRAGSLNEGSLEDLSDRLGITSRYLRQLFTQHLGVSPVAFAQTTRTHFAAQLLEQTRLPITQIALASGFGSIRRFNHVFKETYGKAPRDFKKSLVRDEDTQQAQTSCTLKLRYRPPYDWESALAFLSMRCIPGVEWVADKIYTRSFLLGETKGYFSIRHLINDHAFQLTVSANRMDDLMEITARVRRILDLDANPAAIEDVLKGDAIMAPLLERFPGTRLPGAWEPFEFSVRAILGQQISVKAATTIAGRIATRYGETCTNSPMSEITHYFPTPSQLATQDFEGIGLTRTRTKTLMGMVQAVHKGELTLEVGKSLDDFVKAFTALPGIGPWTAQYVAMRGLSEPDAFPESDLGIIKALSPTEERISPKEVKVLAKAWQPWRGYAAILLWRSLS